MDREAIKKRKKKLGEIIRQKREARGMLQRELAEKAGWNRSYFCQTELGENNPSIEKLFSLAHALDCDIMDLLDYVRSTDAQDYYKKCKKSIVDYFSLMERDMGDIVSELLDTLHKNIRKKLKKRY